MPVSDRKSQNTTDTIRLAFKLLSLTLAFVIVAWLAWQAMDVLLSLFAGILVAIVLTRLAHWIAGKTGLRYPAALAGVLLTLVASLILVGWNIAPTLGEQIPEFIAKLPDLFHQAEQRLRQSSWVQGLLDSQIDWAAFMPQGHKVLGTASGVFSATFGLLGTLVLVAALGIFLAATPQIYIKGFLSLLPVNQRPRQAEVLKQVGDILAAWLTSKFIAMLFIGIVTATGLWLLDIPYILPLALTAGILSFVPNLGPVLALAPALLVAFMQGYNAVLSVAGLYIGVQLVESYALTPFLQQEMVSVPPALALTMQVLMGVVAGMLGVFLAVPLAAAGMTIVKLLYIEDYLQHRLDAA